jgi:hypothetical protein
MIACCRDRAMKPEYVKNASSHNPDGVGISYIHKGKVRIWKTMNHKKFSRLYAKFFQNVLPHVVHFRYATHGPKSAQNAHPYLFHSDTKAFCHNGVFSYLPVYQDRSDSKVFMDRVLNVLPDDFMQHDKFTKMINCLIDMSKIVIMDKTGFKIYNEKEGHWSKGVWYSNDDYKTEPYVYNYPSLPPLKTVISQRDTFYDYSNHVPKGRSDSYNWQSEQFA